MRNPKIEELADGVYLFTLFDRDTGNVVQALQDEADLAVIEERLVEIRTKQLSTMLQGMNVSASQVSSLEKLLGVKLETNQDATEGGRR